MAKLNKVRYPFMCQFPGKKVWDEKISPVEITSSNGDVGIREFDVVCGKKANSNPGNEKFRLLIQRNRQAYQSTSARDAKKKIIEGIIEKVHTSGGRFLKVEGDKVLMEELPFESSYEKVSQYVIFTLLFVDKDSQLCLYSALRSARAPVSNVVRSKEELSQGFGGLLEVQKKLFQEYLAAEGLGLHDEFPTRSKATFNRASTVDNMDVGPQTFDKLNYNELELDQETLGLLVNLR